MASLGRNELRMCCLAVNKGTCFGVYVVADDRMLISFFCSIFIQHDNLIINIDGADGMATQGASEALMLT